MPVRLSVLFAYVRWNCGEPIAPQFREVHLKPIQDHSFRREPMCMQGWGRIKTKTCILNVPFRHPFGARPYCDSGNFRNFPRCPNRKGDSTYVTCAFRTFGVTVWSPWNDSRVTFGSPWHRSATLKGHFGITLGLLWGLLRTYFGATPQQTCTTPPHERVDNFPGRHRSRLKARGDNPAHGRVDACAPGARRLLLHTFRRQKA